MDYEDRERMEALLRLAGADFSDRLLTRVLAGMTEAQQKKLADLVVARAGSSASEALGG